MIGELTNIYPIDVIPLPILTVRRSLQLLNVPVPMVVTLSGISIVGNAGQYANV